MADLTRRVRDVLFVPIVVFAASAALLLVALFAGELRAGALGWRLAVGLGLALAASAASALALEARARRRQAESSTGGPPESDRLRKRLDSLTEEREHLRTVLSSMSEGVLVADVDGRSVLVNESWRELFAVTGEAEGRTALELTRQTELDRMISETLDSGRGAQIELEVTRDRRRTVVLTSSALPDVAGVVVLARDLTPFQRAGDIRRDFVANVSHELKTPLSAIRGFAETLKEGALDDERAARRFVERILKQCRRLEALLSDLLTLSRLEHPAAGTGWAAIDMAALVAEAIDLNQEAVEERDLELVADLRPVPKLEGDGEALVRLCTNLLENAIKYNRPGGRVEVRLQEREGRIELEVSDTGIGISPEAIERLFERFYRVDKGRSRVEGGTGLGLAIVKHAAQLHGGTVEVESELGRGSRFRVSIPVRRPAASRPSEAAAPVARL